MSGNYPTQIGSFMIPVVIGFCIGARILTSVMSTTTHKMVVRKRVKSMRDRTKKGEKFHPVDLNLILTKEEVKDLMSKSEGVLKTGSGRHSALKESGGIK